MNWGLTGTILTWAGMGFAALTLIAYIIAIILPKNRKVLWAGRIGYTLTALSVLGVFAVLAGLMLNKQYQYEYVWHGVSNDLSTWYRFASTWSAQEGSFLLWAALTAIIGFLVLAKAGRYEVRVMPFYVTVLILLCAILLYQSPFKMIPVPSAADLAANPGWHYPPMDGRGLTPSLQNYWMTIHPPTIFFGFASLLVPYVYAIAALIWKDYERWTARVMPYALLSCATLGLGLFMGGYWAYETQGWHGFWGWDPVENASFFPWLAITALVHGLVVQKYRGGMARTNTFLGILAFSLFMLGTFLTRSGILKDVSVHSFAEASGSIYAMLVALLSLYFFGGLFLWLWRYRSMPRRPTRGETLVSRDFAMYLSVLLLILACVAVTLGTTQPIWAKVLHIKGSTPEAIYYNRTLYPLALIMSLAMGCVPWLAWRKTNSETFLRKLLIPWFTMLAFGFGLIFWALGAEHALQLSFNAEVLDNVKTAQAWINPTVQRLAVIALASLGFFAALSNAMLTWRVLRAKPLAAGGWIAHVGIGVLTIGVIISNTYERTERLVLSEGQGPKKAQGYTFEYEKMTGQPIPDRPMNPDYDKENTVQIRVTPPGVEGKNASGSNGEAKTFVIAPRWFVHNLKTTDSEEKFEHMRWPHIQKFLGHDLYVGFANDPEFAWRSDDGVKPGITFQPKEKKQLGPYTVGYFENEIIPGQMMRVHLVILTPDKQIVQAYPTIRIMQDQMVKTDISVPEIKFPDGRPGVIYLDRLDPGSKAADLRINLPDYEGRWEFPLEVTYKPGINIVWTGVIIAVLGTLLAMFRRALEGRKINDKNDGDGPGIPDNDIEEWAKPENVPLVPTAASPIVDAPSRGKAGKLKPTSS